MAANKNGPVQVATAAAGTAVPTLPAAGTVWTPGSGWTALAADLDDGDVVFNWERKKLIVQGPKDVAPQASFVLQDYIKDIKIPIYEVSQDAFTILTNSTTASNVESVSATETKLAVAIEWYGIGLIVCPNCSIHIESVKGSVAKQGGMQLVVEPYGYTGYDTNWKWHTHNGT